ncbi:PRC-barrel domain-containing protein [Hyphomicrobium sp.]|uniref:PRC-barrel domain-containing protein n=1 Tax=Hyphomicrobium sp. TaxID=82 RepID=UPI002D7713BE|nr:PRC-barrel domain-containing protein [Hyphomicrobium sp.]HET6389663.1 PRC-barrel domain-containing protein [Hyphomicrobium sp.]
MDKRFTASLCLLAIVAAASAAPQAGSAADPSPAAEPAAKPPDATGAPAIKEVKPAPPQPSPSGTPAVVVDDSTVASLLGKDVKSPTGEKLGQVTDIIVGRSGDIRAAVIDFGGFLGVGSRKIAVAWAVLHFRPDGIVLGMGADELRVTPEYHPGEPIVIVGSAGAPPQEAKPSSSTQAPAATK